MSHKSLCHTCYTSNISCINHAKTGFPICTKCLKKEAEIEMPNLKCTCKDCNFHNPIQTNSEPTPMNEVLPVEATVEG